MARFAPVTRSLRRQIQQAKHRETVRRTTPMSVLERLNIPPEFGTTLLLLGLILALAPYFSGKDFGIFKVPQFSRGRRRLLYVVGPLLLLFAVSLHIPVLSEPSDQVNGEPPALANLTVRVMHDGQTRGFGLVTPRGFIIVPSVLTSEGSSSDLSVSWTTEDEERSAPVTIVETCGHAGDPAVTLLEPGTSIRPTPRAPIRRARSLDIDEEIELYISPTDRTPGRVRDDYASPEIHTPEGPVTYNGMVATTPIAAAPDIGGAVIDKQGKVVGMLYAGSWGDSQQESIVIPIEDIRACFIDVF